MSARAASRFRIPWSKRFLPKKRKKAGIKPREVSDSEILERLVYALINRGAYLLEEGVAIRPGDIDIVYIYGYGFPPHRGGPMWYADEVGVKNVYDKVVAFGWEPAPLIEEAGRVEWQIRRARCN